MTDNAKRMRKQASGKGCTATEMIPTIEMIPATEMIPNHHRNDPQSPRKAGYGLERFIHDSPTYKISLPT